MDHETSHLPTWQDNKTTSEKAGFAGDDESSALLNDKTKNQQTMQLRQIFANRLMPVAFALPWVMGMLISWIPFTKISLYNAPDFLILAALISTLEVLSIIAVFIFTSLRPSTLETEPSPSTTLKEKFFRAWFWFLFISPFITGTMVVLMASDISCDPEDDLDMHQPICQVGIRLIKATALCRAGIIATFLFATSSYLEQRPTKCCTDSDSA
ncbi:hypothetical protein BKA60DRAFT_542078 [Fusarium oxysporum]|uniref:Transmembrane protein n=1 Tax=Fusarium oxysporum TaxID=5507 RepID=A0A420NZK9_FUSOX|nr:hypothetical protein BKA60DRAFT_542078 [Fusarium oxysporum]RKK85713.1 hypothetical protein BFJ69_g1323 [Fusarium oxysporum]